MKTLRASQIITDEWDRLCLEHQREIADMPIVVDASVPPGTLKMHATTRRDVVRHLHPGFLGILSHTGFTSAAELGWRACFLGGGCE